MIARRRAWQQDDHATFPAIIDTRPDKVAAAPGGDTSENMIRSLAHRRPRERALSIATVQM
jgi:hypothetical protein